MVTGLVARRQFLEPRKRGSTTVPQEGRRERNSEKEERRKQQLSAHGRNN